MLKSLFVDQAGKSIVKSLLETAVVGTGTKAIGSISRIQYGKDDPDAVRKSTIRREAVLLGLTFPFTLVADWVSVKSVLPMLQERFNLSAKALAKHKKVLMLPPTVIGIVAAELIANRLSKKPYWATTVCQAPENQDDDGDVRRVPSRGSGARLNMTLDADVCQFRGTPSPTVFNSVAVPFGNAAYPTASKAIPAGFPSAGIASYPRAALSGFRV